MVLFNYSTKELTAKIVYYGPGLCGKTTNLQFIFENLPSNIHRGKMLSLATKTDRTLFFDFLPIDLGTIRGMRTRLQLYTVPGQVFYNTTRKLVLKGADGVVFVADSQRKAIEANAESFANLEQNLAEHGMKLADMPHIIQFNKRDLPEAASIDELNGALNKHNAPIYEAVATTGIGVQETLKAVTRLVLNSLKDKYGDVKKGDRPAAAPRPVSVAAAVGASAPVAALAEPLDVAPPPLIDPAPAIEIEPEESGAISLDMSGPFSSISAAPPAPPSTPVLELETDDPVLEASAEDAAEVILEEESQSILSVVPEPETVVADILEEASPLAFDEPDDVPSRPAQASFDVGLEVEEPEEPPVLEASPLTVEEAPAIEEIIEKRALQAPPISIEVATAEPFELETASVDPSGSMPIPAALPVGTPSGSQRMGPPLEAAISLATSSAETRAIPHTDQGTQPDGSREASFPIAVEIQGQTLHLIVTVSIRLEKL